MGAIPLCLLVNRLHLFILTQRTFILIQLDTPTCMLHVSACTLAILRHVITETVQRKAQYSNCWCVICTRSPKCQEERGLLFSTFCSIIFRDTWNILFVGVQYWKLIVDVSVNTFLIGYRSRNYIIFIANPPLDLYRKIC